MKIASLHVSNFLGCGAIDVRTPQRIQLFSGRNGAGKSSLRDSIALALTADLGRVSLKKEAAALIRDGADLAVCEVKDEDGDEYRVVINRSGKITDSGRPADPTDPVLPYVLDAQRFERLDATGRRQFLFALTGAKMDAASVKQRLAAKGCDASKVERIAPLLRSGFDAASKEAKTKATEAKGAWRAVTGETYGSEKAKAWRAAVPPHDSSIGAALATELQHVDVAIGSWQEQVGKLAAEEQRRAALRQKLPALQEHAGRIGRIEAKLAADESQCAEWEADVVKTQAAAGAGPRVGLVHDLAQAVTWMWHLSKDQLGAEHAKAIDTAMRAYVAEHGKLGSTTGDEKAQARLPSVIKSRDLMVSSVANSRRDLAAAMAAKAEVETITAELAEVFDSATLTEAREQIDTLKKQRAEVVAKTDAQKSIKALVDGAEAKTKAAAQHAADVSAWDALGDALAPDGIPGEILAEALGPINERLAQSAVDTDWPAVVIAADMAITAGGRAYRLLSESERWRVDAMVAEAVASLSGWRLLLLDRFDVLDLQGRSELLAWLDMLAEAGEIDTALIFGTLKALPAQLPETIGAHWLNAGTCGQLKEAA